MTIGKIQCTRDGECPFDEELWSCSDCDFGKKMPAKEDQE